MELIDKQYVRINELPDTQTGESAVTQLQSVDLTLRLQQLEGSTRAALATLRRFLVEKVPPTRAALAHEAAIAFELADDQQALAMIDEIAQTVGISTFA